VPIDAKSGPIVGRAAELEQLEGALDRLAADGWACLAVEGEPGIGKTRLLAELRKRGEGRGMLVLEGAATEFERDLPFSVWLDALDAYVSSQELDLVERLQPESAAELAALFPSLRRTAKGAHRSVADERYRSHRALRELLEVLAQERPVVVVLDDLHWSDEASIELLAALLRRGPDAAVLFALGFRRGQASQRLSAALAVRAATRLDVAPLDEAEAAELLGIADGPAAAAIYRQGGGNPFYLQQLARVHADGASAVPASVTAALAEELAGLSATQRRLLESAAVAGEPFEPDLAAAIAELPRSETIAALDALLALDLVRTTSVPRRFVFRHPLLRQAVYQSAPGGWKLDAHARAATALASSGAAPAERAHHVEQSAAPGDEAALEILLAAGDAAAARAPAAAARWFEAALRLLPASDGDRQLAARVALASAQRSLGELESCRSTLLEAVSLVPASDVSKRVELTTLCAAVEHGLGRHDEAHRRLTRARQELPGGATAAAAALEIELAVDGLYEHDFDQAVAAGARALESAVSVGDPLLVAAATAALCFAETAAGLIDDAIAHGHEARWQIDRLTDEELAARLDALYHLGWAETYLERYDDAIAHFDRGIELARTIGDGRLLGPMTLGKNFPFEMTGRLAEAMECCESALEGARLSAGPHELFRALFELGWTRYYSGDLDGAIEAHEESSRLDPRLAGGTIPNAGGGPGWGLGVTWFELGEVERARSMLLGLVSEDGARTMPVERCYDWESLTLVELAAGNHDEAEGYTRRSEEDASRLGLKMPAALAARARAAVLLAANRPLDAAEAAHDSAELAAEIGARLQSALSRGVEGRSLAAAGDRTNAIAVLRHAESELDACGSLRVRDELRRELRKLGARSEARGPAALEASGLGALTKRELEIATLATDRRTNREIASTLFLSEKTVESHMRHIFRKLGVSSRVEVARAVEREARLSGS